MTENITYCFNEQIDNDENNNNSTDLYNLLNDFEQLGLDQKYTQEYTQEDNIMSELKNYELNFTIKQLLLICDYYGLTKQTKSIEYYGSKAKKMKKQDIITLIIMFENDTENIEIVIKRKEFWFYLDQLKDDKIMKKFVIW
jgi:hypothetical protein